MLPVSGLLGILGQLVAKIKDGKFIDFGDLLPEALEWAFECMCVEKDERKQFPITLITD